MTGLLSQPVFRLKQTRTGISKEYDVLYKRFQDITDPAQGYKNYKKILGVCLKPAIPYIGLYLSNIAVVQSSQETRTEEGNINFSKYRVIAKSLQAVLLYQLGKYSFKRVKVLEVP